MDEYRVNLDIYAGPLDLLLYLIRRDELDIYDIPIVRITEQYLQYVEMLKALDPNLAGEFLLLASTLLEIKTRMLLPKAPPEEAADDEGLEIDPRAELVRQLLEYKVFKDAAGDLRGAAETRARRFGRPSEAKPPGHEGDDLDLEDVQIWDLFDAFSELMESIGKHPREHEVIYDDTPVELHAADIRDRLEREDSLTFRQVFQGRTSRAEMVGLFLALLELIRQKLVLAHQDANFGEIAIRLNPEPPAGDEDEQQAPQGQSTGRYMSDHPDEEDDKGDDDDEGDDEPDKPDAVGA